VKREYRGKIAGRKEYFTTEFVTPRDCADSVRDAENVYAFRAKSIRQLLQTAQL
jgi:hypothetical protein